MNLAGPDLEVEFIHGELRTEAPCQCSSFDDHLARVLRHVVSISAWSRLMKAFAVVIGGP